ncbi:cell division protein ZipA [Vibrio methylphosphonaticus]|uniref:cell division protein ZipA n=1 Tax=Vibrio methylphosphonaticus TaxID=2946866 RepID=UPI00202A4C99|nr:cell division protein ZipA [Vibrio methylphosphonaticus]MCL9773242.1 cell division protein ZipA [Vibrio methylphosphonaticus]
MQELRFVLIIVGALAIAALLFHGLWSSKKEGQKKFGDRPLGNIDEQSDDDDHYVAPEDDFEIVRKVKSEPDFGLNQQAPAFDPLDDVAVSDEPTKYEKDLEKANSATVSYEIDDVPSFSAKETIDDLEPLEPLELKEPTFDFDALDVDEQKVEPVDQVVSSHTFSEVNENKPVTNSQGTLAASNTPKEPEISEPEEPEMQVLVMNVHCAGSEPFVGSKLFDSMRQNGLIYGDMDIFHRHADLSGTGKVLFSVANMMQPGTLQHDDPETFTTKGISFFMTLPCFGEAEQNFKLMLRTAQQIADDVSGNVLDDQRNLLTPTRIDAYKKQIQDFNRVKAGA